MQPASYDSTRTGPHGPQPPLRRPHSLSGERLSAPAELDLARRARAGDSAARERLIQSGISLVVAIARRYYSRHLEQEDLVQEGILGLAEAVDRFDADRGAGFATYATYWIRRRILAALERNMHLIRLPVDVLYASRRASHGDPNPPAGEESGPHRRVSARRLESALPLVAEPLSLSAAADADPQMPELADTVTPEPETVLLQSEEREHLFRLLGTLSPIERLVVESRFGLKEDPVPLGDLAYRLRTTTEGVRYIQRRAIRKLQKRWLDDDRETTGPVQQRPLAA